MFLLFLSITKYISKPTQRGCHYQMMIKLCTFSLKLAFILQGPQGPPGPPGGQGHTGPPVRTHTQIRTHKSVQDILIYGKICVSVFHKGSTW